MIALDYTFMTAGAVEGGLTDQDLRDGEESFRRAQRTTAERHERGELGFLDLPTNAALLSQSMSIAQAIQGRGITDVVVLGIGGSALGPVAVRSALRPPEWNSLTNEARHGLPRLHVLDNVDPVTVTALLARVDLRTALFLVISKSGSTAETMAQYLVVRGHLDAAGLAPRDHLVLITDPEHGALRAIARAEDLRTADIPPNVGGRYSVLTPVGIVPAALIGVDIAQLMAGAEAMRARCEASAMSGNPAGAFATLQWLAHERRGRSIHVLMPYSDPLRDVASWFVQLWAESLGKTRQDGRHVGPMPVGARGTSDQHSQMQLFMDGPLDKTVTFIAVANPGADSAIPAASGSASELAYLTGHRLGELLAVEQRASAAALAKRGRLSITVTIDRVDAWHVGGLFMWLEIATAYAGELYAVNAFDQPGVELGKRFTYALLDRPGFDDARREWQALPQSDPRYIV